MHYNRGLMVGNLLLDTQFQKAAWDENRLGDVSLAPFVALANVDDDGTRFFHQVARFFNADLLN